MNNMPKNNGGGDWYPYPPLNNPPAYMKHISKAPTNSKTKELTGKAENMYKSAQSFKAGSGEKLMALRKSTAYGWTARLQHPYFKLKEMRFTKSNIERLKEASLVTQGFKKAEDEGTELGWDIMVNQSWDMISKAERETLITDLDIGNTKVNALSTGKEVVEFFRKEVIRNIGFYTWQLYLIKGEKVYEEVYRYFVYWKVAVDEGLVSYGELPADFQEHPRKWPLSYPDKDKVPKDLPKPKVPTKPPKEKPEEPPEPDDEPPEPPEPDKEPPEEPPEEPTPPE